MISKSFSPFEGFPPLTPGKPKLVHFYTGEDILLTLPLFFDDLPVTPDKWMLRAVMVSTIGAKDITWEGVLNNGVYYKPEFKGLYNIVVPASVTEKLQPGTYWLDLLIKEPVGASNDIVDKSVLIGRIAISLEYSAASKNTPDYIPPSLDITLV